MQARVAKAARSSAPAGIRHDRLPRTSNASDAGSVTSSVKSIRPTPYSRPPPHSHVRPFTVARFHRRPKAGWERPSNPNPNPNLNPNPNPNPSLSPSPTGRALACRFGDRVVIAEFVNVSAVRRPPPAAARATTVAFSVTRAYSNPNPNPKPNPNPNPNPSLNPNPNPDPDPNPNPNPNPSTSPNPNPNPNQVTHAYDRVASLPAIAIDPMITSGR